jgi:hypothetical protein
MKYRLLTTATLAAILAGGAAYAADTTPAPASSTPTPPAASAMPAAAPAMPAATTPATIVATPAVAAKPVAHHPVVSACTRSVETAEKVLASSKMPAENIAEAWQHIDAAKTARMDHKAKDCEMESQTAVKMLGGKA